MRELHSTFNISSPSVSQRPDVLSPSGPVSMREKASSLRLHNRYPQANGELQGVLTVAKSRQAPGHGTCACGGQQEKQHERDLTVSSIQNFEFLFDFDLLSFLKTLLYL
jgi:hypothetical protein